MKEPDGHQNLHLSVLDRLVLVGMALFLLAVAGWGIVSAFGWQGRGSLAFVLADLGLGKLESSMIALIMLLAGLHVLFLGIHRERDETIQQQTELGHVRISLRAIETLVRRSTQEIRGIQDVDVHVVQSPEGVAIRLSLVVAPEVSVPRISDEVSRSIQARVRETIGIHVGDVGIKIRNIAASESRARVE